MAMKKEALTNLIADDLAKRNDNWTEIDDTFELLTAQLAEKVQNFKLKNEVVNGDFSQGTTGWFANNSTIVNEEGKLKLTGSTTRYVAVRTNNGNTVLNGNVYYINFKANALSSLTRIRVWLGGSQSTDFTGIIASVEKDYSARISATSNYGYQLLFEFDYGTNENATGKISYLDNVIFINLTATFGAGNEPTKLEMDELMKVIPNQWWDGELSLTQKQYVIWKLNLWRKTTNAVIALGGTII